MSSCLRRVPNRNEGSDIRKGEGRSSANLSLSSPKNPSVADSLVTDIDSKLELLGRFPFMGRERPELAPSLRSVLVWSYVIFYMVDAAEIVVVRMVDGRMDIDKEFQDWPVS